MEILEISEGFIKEILTSPLIFLIVIAISIVWQQQNSKKLAEESGQFGIQASVFSWIMSLAIFISVVNDMMMVAYIGVAIEMVINVFLVLSDRRKIVADILMIDNKLDLFTKMQKKGIEIIDLKNQKVFLLNESNRLAILIRIFIAALMPLSLLVLSHLYITSN